MVQPSPGGTTSPWALSAIVGPVAEAAPHDQVGERGEARRPHLPGRDGKALDREAHGLQQAGGALRVGRVVAGRGVGRHAHQLAQERHLLLEARLDQPGDLGLRDWRHVSSAPRRRLSTRRTVSSSTRTPTSASSTVIDSAGLWLMPSLQRRKIMPDGHSLAIIMASWPAPEESSHDLQAAGGDRLAHGRGDAGIERGGRHLLVDARLQLDAAAHGDVAQQRQQLALRAVAHGVGRAAHVDRELHAAGDDVGRARPGVDAADGGDQVGVRGAEALDAHDHLGGGRQRIAAKAHRHRAGVAGEPAHRDDQADGAVDGRDGRARVALVVEHRPLLDVQLQIGGDVALLARAAAIGIGVAAGRGERIAHADALAVAGVEDGGLQRADQRAGGEKVGRKAHALLLAERHHLDGVVEPLAAAGHVADRGDGGQHAEIAVVLAGIDHGVDVRAEHDRGARRASWPRSGR